MNKKIIGIVLILIGCALAFWGYGVYDSVGSKLGRALTGDTPIEAWLGMVGGAICVVVGILNVKGRS
jgi:uncharacterized membrane protein YidH (DUF202 family)